MDKVLNVRKVYAHCFSSPGFWIGKLPALPFFSEPVSFIPVRRKPESI
jgi:hypothetical protein